MSHYVLVYFLVIEFAFCRCDIKFKIEIVSAVAQPFYTDNRSMIGPRFNEQWMGMGDELCMEAKNYIAADLEEKYKTHPATSAYDGFPTYIDFSAPPYCYDVIACSTIPRIWLRPDHNDSECILIMITEDEISEIQSHIHSFKVELSTTPVQITISDGPKRDPAMVNNSLRKIYTHTSLLHWLHICVKAMKQRPFDLKNQIKYVYSEVGHYLIRVFNHSSGQAEEHHAFKCPITPPIYVYFAGSEPEVKVVARRGFDVRS